MTDHEALGVPEDVTLEGLKARFHALALEHHPDKGGDTAVFQDLLAAYKRLEAELLAPRGCDACQGTGKVVVVNGFASTKVLCEACGGTGEVGP